MGCDTCKDIARGRRGDPGVTYIPYYAYSSDENGTGFSLVPSQNLPFIQRITLTIAPTTLTLADFPLPFFRWLGQDGISQGYDYLFSQSVVNADPGDGNLRLDDTNLNNAVNLIISKKDANGVDISGVLDTLYSTSTIWAIIKIVSKNDPSKFVVYSASGVGVAAYYDFTIVYLAGLTTQFDQLEPLSFSFSIVGDKGDPGTPGTNGTNGVIPLHYSQGNQSGNTSGLDSIIDTYTIPAGKLASNGDLVTIDAIVVNLDTDVVTTVNRELSRMDIVHSTGTFPIAAPDFQFWAEQHRFVINLQRISASQAAIDIVVYYAGGSQINYLAGVAVDFSQSIDINVIAKNIIASTQTYYQFVGKLYVSYISI